MFRLLSKITLIVVALTLISTQAGAQSADGLPVLYRNGEQVAPGSPPDPPEPTTDPVLEDTGKMPEDLGLPNTSGSVLPQEEVEAAPPIVAPPVEHNAADTELGTEEEPEGLLGTPEVDSGMFGSIMQFGIVGAAIAGVLGAFLFLRNKRKASQIEIMPQPIASMTDSPSKLREAIAEMKQE